MSTIQQHFFRILTTSNWFCWTTSNKIKEWCRSNCYFATDVGWPLSVFPPFCIDLVLQWLGLFSARFVGVGVGVGDTIVQFRRMMQKMGLRSDAFVASSEFGVRGIPKNKSFLSRSSICSDLLRTFGRFGLKSFGKFDRDLIEFSAAFTALRD